MTDNKKLNCFEAKQFSIVEFLNNHGFKSVRHDNNNNHWYISPFRDEKEPSFRVNTSMNVWYDYGSGEGGSIIDLGIKIHDCNVSEFLEILSAGNKNINTIHPVRETKSPLKVTSVNNLNNRALLNYLGSRGISAATSKKYCKEVYFEIDQKRYFAVGFPNRSGGYELRNSFYKGCIAPKDITLIKENHPIICVFEGFVDFLSFFMLKVEVPVKSDYMVLNSVALLDKALDELIDYERVFVFFDNDNSGKNAFKVIQQHLRSNRTADMSHIYSAHKDMNEYLLNMTQKLKKKRSKGFGLDI